MASLSRDACKTGVSGEFSSFVNNAKHVWSCLVFSGGSVLFIESSLINPVEALETPSSSGKDDKSTAMSGSLTLTGKLGDVMKESCKIALTYAKSYLQHIDPTNRALRVGHIHVHVPEVSEHESGDLAELATVLGSNT